MATRGEQGDKAPLATVAEGFFDDRGEGAATGGMPALCAAFPMEILGPATGTEDRDLAVGLLMDVARGLNLIEGGPSAGGDENEDTERSEDPAAARGQEWALLSGLAAMRAIAPRDGLEGMLAAQMVCTHGAAVEFTGRATRDGQPMAVRAAYMRQAARLMALFTSQIDVLGRRRGAAGGMNVGRVNVEAGGQAIVGSVNGKSPDMSRTAE